MRDFFRQFLITFLEAIIKIDLIAERVFHPVVDAINKMTGASSKRICTVLFPCGIVLHAGASVIAKAHPLHAALSVAVLLIWMRHFRSIADQLDEPDDILRVPAGDLFMAICARGSTFLGFVTILPWALVTPTLSEGCYLLADVVILIAMTAGLAGRGSRRSVLADLADKAKDAITSLIPSPTPAPVPI